jgi:putative heme-binding domain-containing protein
LINNDSLAERRFVKKWQHHGFGDAPDNLGERNLERGKLVFEQATCSRCHNIGPGEKKLGPDLTEVVKRFQGAKLLTQIVRPSAEINKDFKTQMILGDDGKMRTGLVIQETDDEIHFIPNLLKPERIEVMAKDSIEERKTADISTMPTGLLDTFTQEEIFDLLAYIQSRGQQ